MRRFSTAGRLVGAVLVATLFVGGLGRSGAPGASASPPPGMTDLGTLGGPNSSAFAVNDSGQVTGSSDTSSGQRHAFLWTSTSPMLDLGTVNGATELNPQGISSTGQVVGNTLISGADAHGFSWTAASGMVDVGTLGGTSSHATGVNDSGEVTGFSPTSGFSGTEHAFVWRLGSGLTDIGTFGGGQSEAFGINETGQVVGWSYNAAGDRRAFSWTQAGGMVDLGALGPGGSGGSEAIAVNDNGQVVGDATTAAGPEHAFSWTQAGGMVDLGTVPGSTYSVATAVSPNGRVAGFSGFADGSYHAFSWTQATGMVDLGTLGGSRSDASAVNDNGVVVGWSDTSNGQRHAFAWTEAGGMIDLDTADASSSANSVNADNQVVGLAGAHAAFWQLAAADLGFVSRNGAGLSLDGQPFRPIGLNIYNANSNGWCANEMSGSAVSDALAAMGSGKNAMRAWFFQQLATTNGARDWTAFDRTLAAARAHGYKVIATLIDQWGNCGATNGLGYGYKDASWYQDGYKQSDPSATVSYRDWVQEVVARYKNDPTILAWQLVNEPEVGNCDVVSESAAAGILSSFAGDVSGLIKSIDPNHLVSLGTIGSGQCGASGPDYATVMSTPTLDLCEYHDYTPSELIPGDQFNGLGVRLNQCNALNKPLLIGELGVDPANVGGTLADRASVVDAKLCAELSAGVAGELLWAWNEPDPFDILPGDPVLSVLAPWSDPSHVCSAPSAPFSAIAAAGDGSAAVSWQPPASSGGSVIRSYTVASDSGGFTATVGGDQTSATISGLVNGVSHTFTVTATNAAGTSVASAPSAPVTPQAGSFTPVAVSGAAGPGGAITTDPGGVGPTPLVPVTTAVMVPAGGQVGIAEGAVTEAPPAGYSFLGEEVSIDAPAAAPDAPLQLTFTIDGSLLGSLASSDVAIFRTEAAGSPTAVLDCGGAAGVASPDPCISARAVLAGGDLRVTVLTSTASTWDVGVVAEPRVTISSVSKSLVGGGDPSTKISWHGDENGAFSVRVGGTSCSTGTQVASGSYTGEPAAHVTTVNTTSLAEGANTIRVCLTDAAHRTNSATILVTRDTTAPGVTIDSVIPAVLNAASGSTTVTWHASENGSWSLRVGGGSCTAGTQVAGGSYVTAPAAVAAVVNASSFPNGASMLRACVSDAAGNAGSQTTAVTKDTAPPVVTVDSVSPAVLGASGSTVLTWHANTNGAFSIVVGGSDCGSGTPVASGSYSGEPAKTTAGIVASSLGEGPNTVRVCVTDPAGNTGAKTTSITKDTTAPLVAIDGVTKSVLGVGGSTSVTWHATENGPFSVLAGGSDCASGTQVASGNYTGAPATRATTVKATSLVEGPNAIRVCVADAAGNKGSQATTVIRDTTQPVVGIDGVSAAVVSAGGSAVVSWHADENGRYSVRVGGSCTAGTQVGNGSYSTEPATVMVTINASSLANGANTIRICVTDAAGNTGFATLSVKKDATAPTITLTKPADNATYTLGQTVLATFACKDETGGSGIASCVGTAANGTPIDTSSRGTKTFSVTATDQAGNTTTRSISYTVA